MMRLGELEVNDLWVEAGATLAGSLLDAQLVDQLVVYQAPTLIGAAGRSLANTQTFELMSQLESWSMVDQRRIGPDLKTVYSPNMPRSSSCLPES
jgi:diaminohydroxyphosphoribosylaminopyrimidine deaminase/5-amino-6-(5-phosphoribosylamino)uracil reductase